MTYFHNSVRAILKDVEHFLVIDLHDVSISNQGRDRKNTILNNLHQLRLNFPELIKHDPVKPPSDSGGSIKETPKKQVPKQAPKIEFEEPEETYDDIDIPENNSQLSVPSSKEDSISLNDDMYESYKKDVAVSELQNPSMEGMLLKKRKKEGNKLMAVINPYQKRYCVIKGNVFFYFTTQTDTKQSGAILLTDYETRPYTCNKEKFTFELVAAAKRTYQFAASSQEEMEEWMKAIERGSNLTPEYADDDEIYAEADDFETNRNVPPSPAAKHAPPPPPQEDEYYDDTVVVTNEDEEFYDDIETPAPPAPVRKHGSPQSEVKRRSLPPPPPPSSSPPPLIQEEVYDDCDNFDNEKTQVQQPSPPLSSNKKTLPPPPPAMDEVYDEASSAVIPEEDEEIYDECENFDQDKINAHNQSQINNNSPPKTPLSAKNSNQGDIDYERFYCGIWDCKGSEDNELSFHRGDLIYILNKDYDSYSWWVGELHGKVGLVPKDYLMEAYEVSIE